MRALVDWFANREGDPGDRGFDRRRVLVQGSLAAAFVTIGLVIHRFVMTPEPGLVHANVIASLAFMLLCPFVLKFTGSYTLASHWLVAPLTTTFFVDMYLYGGLTAPGTYALFVVPIMATFFLGSRVSIAYTAAVMLALIVTFFGDASTPAGPGREELLAMLLVGSISILVFLQLVARVYEVERDNSLARIRAITDNLVDGVVAIDREGRVQLANTTVQLLLGTGEIRGKWAQDAFDGDLLALIGRTQETGSPTVADIALPGDRTGTAQAAPIVLDTGERAGTVVVLRDRTLELSVDRMKTDFISTVSHELRTPMTSVLGFTRIIRNKLERVVFPAVDMDDARRAKAVGQIRDNLDIIAVEGTRLTALINDVLDISKMESGHVEWNRTDIDVARLVARAVETTGGLFEGREVALRSEVASDLPSLNADEDRLLQVLINLVSNASKFTEMGSVTLRARDIDGDVLFTVSDTGPGIPEADRQAIFDRFRQSVGGTRAKGTGLGLAICAEIVAAHGGRIWVESELGEGSSFQVRLPISDNETDR